MIRHHFDTSIMGTQQETRIYTGAEGKTGQDLRHVHESQGKSAPVTHMFVHRHIIDRRTIDDDDISIYRRSSFTSRGTYLVDPPWMGDSIITARGSAVQGNEW